MSLESLDSRKGDAVPFTGFSMSWNHSLKNNPFRIPFRPLLIDARTPSWGVHRVTTETPKYSCRDCWTGVNPMENQQQKPDLKPLWGLKKKPSFNKPKEKRILETVNRMITRIQTTKETCLWSNTPTRPAWECRYPSRRIWLPSVTRITSMNLTWWDVPSCSSWRTFNKTPHRTHGICLYEVTLGHPSDMTF